MDSVAELKKSFFGEIDTVEKRENSAKLRTVKLGRKGVLTIDNDFCRGAEDSTADGDCQLLEPGSVRRLSSLGGESVNRE